VGPVLCFEAYSTLRNQLLKVGSVRQLVQPQRQQTYLQVLAHTSSLWLEPCCLSLNKSAHTVAES